MRSTRTLPSLVRLAALCAVAVELLAAAACRDIFGGSRDPAPVLWRRAIAPDHQWHGTPAAADGRVFFDVADGITAVDQRTGDSLWHTALPARTRPFPSTRLLLARGGLVLAPDEEATYALDASTGALRWQVTVDTAATMSRAAVDDGTLYVGTKGRLVVALALADGARRWSVDVGPDWLGGNVIGLAVSGDTLYAAAMRRPTDTPVPITLVVVALDRRDGHELWRWSTPAAEDHTTYSEPVVAGNLLLVSDESARALVALDRFAVTERWKAQSNFAYAGPGDAAVVAGDVAYFGSGDSFVYAVDLATGAPRWHTSVGSSVDGIALCGGRIFAHNQGADVLDARDGRHLAEVVSGSDDFLTSGFLSSEGRVFASGTQALYALRC